MKLKIRNGFVYDEEEVIVATITPNATADHERTIALGSELVDQVSGFIERVNSGSFKARSEVKNFEQILNKYE